ncbi:hypothetical protein J40TS1_00230 [Paenibacillus montaniterrae]|uniref:CD-NTase-associated protein 12/Pycsar effector protein TIR domain-containing protein n=1 Tax=Paenibacillus montaniterrae TaxID=429341 RepID=A0A919YN84_9BACL|nr:nucleotide-binding protein [Paenibacillus montaniterrae]GIP14381.1 hypothetical protein J40TS1_00230 [Paenibacillus montaniterrae]
MARGKDQTKVPQRKRVSLVVPRESAKQKIESQIESGLVIRDLPKSNRNELKQAENEKNSWESYTKELLLRLFDDDQYSEEFAMVGFHVMYSPGESSLLDDINDFYDEMDGCLNYLRNLDNKLELIPEINQSKIPNITNIARTTDFNKVFIIHGHDNEAKVSAARFIEKLGLTAVIFHEQESRGNTIIEKLERLSDVGYAIVLLTPDDFGYSKNSTPESATSRARQNVVFEWGYFIAKLGRNKVSALLKGDIEIPSDLQGVLWERIDENGAWEYKVAKELRAAGYEVDMNKL